MMMTAAQSRLSCSTPPPNWVVYEVFIAIASTWTSGNEFRELPTYLHERRMWPALSSLIRRAHSRRESRCAAVQLLLRLLPLLTTICLLNLVSLTFQCLMLLKPLYIVVQWPQTLPFPSIRLSEGPYQGSRIFEIREFRSKWCARLLMPTPCGKSMSGLPRAKNKW